MPSKAGTDRYVFEKSSGRKNINKSYCTHLAPPFSLSHALRTENLFIFNPSYVTYGVVCVKRATLRIFSVTAWQSSARLNREAGPAFIRIIVIAAVTLSM